MKAVSITALAALASAVTFTSTSNCSSEQVTYAITGASFFISATSTSNTCGISSSSVSSSIESITSSSSEEPASSVIVSSSIETVTSTALAQLVKRQTPGLSFVLGNAPCVSATTAGGLTIAVGSNPGTVDVAALCVAGAGSIQSIVVLVPGADAVCTTVSAGITCPAVSTSSSAVATVTTTVSPVVNVNVTVNVVVDNCATCGVVTRHYYSPLACVNSVIAYGVCYVCPQNLPVLVASPVILCAGCTATIAVASVSTAPVVVVTPQAPVQPVAPAQPTRPVVPQVAGASKNFAGLAAVAAAAALL